MPIQNCSDSGKPGYKWGDSGKCYIYTSGDEESKMNARKKALAQGIASGDIEVGSSEKANEVTTSSMGSGIKKPQKGYGRKKKTKKIIDEIEKSLAEWFEEKWVDISRPKPGGGFEPCGRPDASSGKYPKCVPASRAARMTPEQIRSAVRRKRRAESTQTRDGKKPINVSTSVEKALENVPTNPGLYARVKAEAKRKFDVYPSAYANAWLVREYKRRGGKYKTVSKSSDALTKVAEDLTEDEAMLAILLEAIASKYGKFDEDGTGIWAGYEPAEENDDKEIGVKCSNCVLYAGDGVCKIIAGIVEPEGKCRFAVIPDGVVEMDDQEDDEDIDELIENIFDSYLVNKNFSEEKNMIIQLPYDNVQIVKRKHDSMKAWHEDMAKSHEIAAAWHGEQSEDLGKAMKEVPLNPEEVGGKTYPAKGQSTDGPDPAAPTATNVPIDPIKKADLIQILNDHIAEFGEFSISPEEIVDKIIGD